MSKSSMFFAILVVVVQGCSCSTVRELRDPATLAPDGKAGQLKENGALAYTVATTIHAPPEAIWKVLTDAPAYTGWNSTVVRLDGTIALGQEISLVSKVAPDRTFKLKVSDFQPGKRMVWEDGMPMGMFSGVRTFTLTAKEGGATHFGMSEVLSGGMLGMMEGSLPDFRPSFEAFAGDLKRKVEGSSTASATR